MKKLVILFCAALLPISTLGNDNFITKKQKKDVNLLTALKTSMDYALKRHMLLSQNIAAKEVPKYRAKDLKKINFNLVSDKGARIPLSAAITRPNHIISKVERKKYKILEDKSNDNTSIIENNVDLTDQLYKINENMANYNLATTLYKQSTNLLKVAIGK